MGEKSEHFKTNQDTLITSPSKLVHHKIVRCLDTTFHIPMLPRLWQKLDPPFVLKTLETIKLSSFLLITLTQYITDFPSLNICSVFLSSQVGVKETIVKSVTTSVLRFFCHQGYQLPHRTGFKFMANKQFRMEIFLGISVCADISHYALKNQCVQFLQEKITQQNFFG